MSQAADIRTLRVADSPAIAVDTAGSGPLIVFLHGIGGNRSNWHDQFPVLTGNFTVASWDARGYGDSDDYEGPLRVADFGDDLEKVLDHFGVRKAHIAGLSMGGAIAQHFWATRPDRVATLILADTSAGLAQTLKPEQLDEFIRSRQNPLLEGKEPKDIAGPVSKTLCGPGAVPGALEKLVASMAQLHKESYIKTIDSVTRFTGYPDPGSITVPSLVIVGEDDNLVTPEIARSFADRIPGAEFEIVPRAGHLSNLEQPDAFNERLLRFLSRHGGLADMPASGSA